MPLTVGMPNDLMQVGTPCEQTIFRMTPADFFHVEL